MLSTYVFSIFIIDRNVKIYFIVLDIRPEFFLTLLIGAIKTLHYRRDIEYS